MVDRAIVSGRLIGSLMLGISQIPFMVGCGSEDSDEDDLLANEGPADYRLFVPEGVPLEYIGIESGELVVETSTFEVVDGVARWLASVRNAGQRTACDLALAGAFEGDVVRPLAILAPVHTPMYWIGIGGRCLGPGDVGFAEGRADYFASEGGPRVARIDYLIHRSVAEEATPLTTVSIRSVRVVRGAGDQKIVRGTVINSGTEAIRPPQVSFFPLNAVDRPLTVGSAISETELKAGGTWEFELHVTGPVQRHAVFVEYLDF